MQKHNIVGFICLLTFPLYVASVAFLPASIVDTSCSLSSGKSSQNVGFCFKVSATVERGYYFGLVDMKTRVLGNNVDGLNRLAAPFTLLLAALARTVIYRA